MSTAHILDVSNESTPQTPSRYHAFDSLRALAMLLGIPFHASLAYSMGGSIWPLHDATSLPLTLFAWCSHGFRMQLFFILAGFFSNLVCKRYGIVGALKHRAIRLLVPFVVAVPIHNLLAYGLRRLAGQFPRPPWLPVDGESAWSVMREAHAGVLWFLEYLICLTALLLCATALLSRLGAMRTLGWKRAFEAIARPKLAVLLLAFPHALLLYANSQWYVEMEDGLQVEPLWLAYYGIFFGYGWLLYGAREVLSALKENAGRYLLAVALVMPLALGCIDRGYHGADDTVSRFIAMYLLSLYGWLMALGLMGAFLRLLPQPIAWLRYLADASYWIYLVHLYVVLCLQSALLPLQLSPIVKCALVVTFALPLLLLSYHLLVRFTWIGAVLNGRKLRRSSAAKPRELALG